MDSDYPVGIFTLFLHDLPMHVLSLYIFLFVLGTNRCPSDFLHYRHLNFCIFVALFQVLIGVHQIFSIIDTYISVYCFALFQELIGVHQIFFTIDT